VLPRTAGERTSLVVGGVKIKMSGMIYIERRKREIRKVAQEEWEIEKNSIKRLTKAKGIKFPPLVVRCV
jgi:hypothetical protein